MDLQKIKILDSWGDTIGSTMVDQLMTAKLTRLAGGVFNGSTPDTNFYTTSTAANGTATIASSLLDLATTVDSGSSAILYTNSIGRYMGANMNSFRTISRFGDTGTANNTRILGAVNDSSFTDGFYFCLAGTTFSVGYKTGGSETLVNSGSFNGTNTTWTVDTNFHTFEILYTNKRIQFYIDNVLIHSLTQTTTVFSGTRHLRPYVKNTNTGVGSVCHLYCQIITVSRWGESGSQPKYYYQAGLTAGILLKVGSGAVHALHISGITDGAVVTIYNGLTTAGSIMYSTGTIKIEAQSNNIPFDVNLDGAGGLQFDIGLYLTITTAAANVTVRYE